MGIQGVFLKKAKVKIFAKWFKTKRRGFLSRPRRQGGPPQPQQVPGAGNPPVPGVRVPHLPTGDDQGAVQPCSRKGLQIRRGAGGANHRKHLLREGPQGRDEEGDAFVPAVQRGAGPEARDIRVGRLVAAVQNAGRELPLPHGDGR